MEEPLKRLYEVRITQTVYVVAESRDGAEALVDEQWMEEMLDEHKDIHAREINARQAWHEKDSIPYGDRDADDEDRTIEQWEPYLASTPEDVRKAAK